MMLSAKQSRFVGEYLIDLNAKQAAIRAGYSKKTAEQQGCRLLRNVQVCAEVAERQAKVAEKLEITHESIVAELAKIAFANMADFIAVDGDLSKLTRDQAAALVESTVEETKRGDSSTRRVRIKLADKRAALVDLGKSLGMFKDGPPSRTPNGDVPLTRIERVIVDVADGRFVDAALNARERP